MASLECQEQRQRPGTREIDMTRDVLKLGRICSEYNFSSYNFFKVLLLESNPPVQLPGAIII